eukprot:9499313-Pyramimonas_sp.AAC.3
MQFKRVVSRRLHDHRAHEGHASDAGEDAVGVLDVEAEAPRSRVESTRQKQRHPRVAASQVPQGNPSDNVPVRPSDKPQAMERTTRVTAHCPGEILLAFLGSLHNPSVGLCT